MLRSLTAFAAVSLLAALASPACRAAPSSRSAADPTRVHLITPNGGTDAFVALPGGRGPVPGIVVVHEWWGVNPQIQELARRLARQGYVAIVPDLYHGKVADDSEQAHVLLRGVEPGVAMAEIETAAKWLRAQPRVAKSKLGIVGFCMGGGYALAYALQGGDVSAAITFYGAPETDAAKLAGLKAAVQGHFGAEDDGIPVDRVEAFRTALAQAGKTSEIYVYPGAGHAFMHDGRASYRPDAAKQAWARMLAFLQRHLEH